jgi:signal transduction histidine kinase
MRPAWQRYGGAIALTLLVVAVRHTLDPWWGHHHNRHLVFLPTVMIAAWFGGVGPGLVATLLSAVALDVFWSDTPTGTWHLPSSDLVLYIALCIAISRLIDSLQRARARADSATRSRERVLEIVAHDLRSPLNAIKITSSTIEQAEPELRPKLGRIERAVARMENLIRDLVDTTRIEHGQLVVQSRTEPVAPILREAVDLFSSAAHEKSVSLEADGVREEATVCCDRERILQVLSNFVGNAMKHTPRGGRIRVTAEERREAFQFAVADTGDGIRAEDLPHVFEQYWKGGNGGTGLGLFIAQSIVSAHGGRIWVESKPAAGATFYFTLPR